MSLLASSTRRWRMVCAACFTLVAFVFGGSMLGLPAIARAADAADEPAPRPGREQVQQLHEQCQRQIDEGRAVEAAECLVQVYDGLVALDSYATVDLYYVLLDAVASLDAAAKAEPRGLCRAREMIEDYRKREPRLTARKYASKVAGLQKKVAAALEQARGSTGRDICAEEPPTSVEAPDPDEAPPDEPPPAEPPPPSPVEQAPDDVPVLTPTPEPAPRVKPPPPAMKVQRMTPRRRLFQSRLPDTALLDASFGVTLAGAVAAGLGAGLYIYGLECKDDPMRCAKPAPTGVRDAGLVLMSTGAAAMIVGFGLRFADHRAARKAMRNMPRPAVSPTAMGLTWAANF